jgi:hypothetical protein
MQTRINLTKDYDFIATYDCGRRNPDLAGLDLPTGLDPGTGLAIRAQIVRSFVFGFRLVLLICSGLAVASSGVSILMIPSAKPQAGNAPRSAGA